MSDTHETIADIRKDAEAKFRELVEAYMQRRAAFQTTVGAMQTFNTVFDRLETAHKRELDALNEQITDLRQQRDLWSKRAAELVEKCNEQYAKLKQVGNAAKLREALEAIISGYENADLCDTNYGEWCHEPANPCVNVSLCKAIHESRVALSAPPRNCDRFATVDEARKAHEEYRGDYIMRASNIFDFPMKFEAWLLAPATEKEGGAK